MVYTIPVHVRILKKTSERQHVPQMQRRALSWLVAPISVAGAAVYSLTLSKTPELAPRPPPTLTIHRFCKPNNNAPTLTNACVLVSHQLTRTECQSLSTEIDQILDHTQYLRDCYSVDHPSDLQGLRRVSIQDMSAVSRQLSHDLIFNRILPVLQAQQPQLLEELGFLHPCPNKTFALEFASDEPAINRYMPGGEFEPHEDGYALTLVVLLSDEFEGGGTMFWPSSGTGTDGEGDVTDVGVGVGGVHDVGVGVGGVHPMEEDDGELMQPTVGTALLFNGDITHAGVKVLSGVRHVFVASFNCCENCNGSTEEGVKV